MYSHDQGISSVVVIQLTLAVNQVLHISNPTFCQSFLLCDRISVTKLLNARHNDNKA
jgi:hypothetical protein